MEVLNKGEGLYEGSKKRLVNVLKEITEKR